MGRNSRRNRSSHSTQLNTRKINAASFQQPGQLSATSSDTASPLSDATAQASTPPMLKGGRQTQPVNPNLFGLFTYQFIARRNWQNIDLNELQDNPNLTAQQLLELLADLSPEVSQAVWNYQRLVNGGYTYQVRTLDDTDDMPEGQELLNRIVDHVNKESGGIDSIIDQLVLTGCTQGAFAAELAFNEDFSDIEDLYPVQPWTIYFQRDPQTQRLVPYQQQVMTQLQAMQSQDAYNSSGLLNQLMLQNIFPPGSSAFPYRRLNPVTFSYIPVAQAVDDPYGRPPFAPALQVVTFYMQLLSDLRKSIHVNAWGRLSITVLEKMVIDSAPPQVKADPTGNALREYVKSVIAGITEDYNSIEPDDAIVHTDSVTVEGVNAAGGTLQVDSILRAVERLMFRSLKQLPVLMGSNEGTTETHGTVQMQIYSGSISSFQTLIANLLERLFTVALQNFGIAAKVIWKFAEVRSTDRLQEANAEAIEINNAAAKRDQGWTTQDDASIAVTGSKAIADPVELAVARAKAFSAAMPKPAAPENQNQDQDEPPDQQEDQEDDPATTQEEKETDDETTKD